MKSIIETLYDTSDSLIYFSILQHRYLSYIPTDIYKDTITCVDKLMEISLVKEAKNNKILLDRLRMLPENWHGVRIPKG